MSQQNAFFTYKSKGALTNSHESKIDELINTTNHFVNEFNLIKSEMMRDDIRAAKYKHEILNYFNKPKDQITDTPPLRTPKRIKKSRTESMALSENTSPARLSKLNRTSTAFGTFSTQSRRHMVRKKEIREIIRD